MLTQEQKELALELAEDRPRRCPLPSWPEADGPAIIFTDGEGTLGAEIRPEGLAKDAPPFVRILVAPGDDGAAAILDLPFVQEQAIAAGLALLEKA